MNLMLMSHGIRVTFMISKTEFIATIQRQGSPFTGNEAEFKNYDQAVAAAEKVLVAMPGIGFASIGKRYNTFISVCRHLDALIQKDEISLSESQLAILILRLSSKPFLKAAIAFESYAAGLRALTIFELPSAAREYCAGIKAFG